MKIKKYLLSVFTLAFCAACFWMISGNVNAYETDYGDLHYSYEYEEDEETGYESRVLTISPKDMDTVAEIPNFKNADEVPWIANDCDPTLVVLDQISYIGDYAFYGMQRLESVKFKASNGEYGDMAGVGKYAFAKCTSLTNFAIPPVNCTDDRTFIGAHAFDGCSNIEGKLYIPYNTELGAYAFRGCKNLTAVCFEMGDNYPNNLSAIPASCFSGCTSLKTCSIPLSVKTIGQYAFYNTALTSVSLKCNVKSVGKGAFKKSKIAKANIDGSVTKWGAEAFASCTKLKTIVFYGAAPKTGTRKYFSSTAFKGDSATVYYPKNSTGWATAKKSRYGAKKLTWKTWRFGRPTLTSVKNTTSKAMTVKWKNLSPKSDGYQICYSTSSSFKAGTCHYVQIGNEAKSGAAVNSRKITGLKKGKTYYVRIRAIKGDLNSDDDYNYIYFRSQYSAKMKVKITK